MSKEEIYDNLLKNATLEKFKIKEKKKRERTNFFQILCAFIICAISITSMVYAKNISEKIVYHNEYFTGNGVGKAISEGYIEEPENAEMQVTSEVQNAYSGEIIDNVEAKLSIKDFLMDDFNLSITFELEFDESVDSIIPVKEMRRVFLSGLIISDENENILFHYSPNDLNEFLKKNDMDLDVNNTKDYLLVNTGVDSFIKTKSGNKLTLVYDIYSDGEFPKSKELFFTCNKINATKEEGVFPGEGEIMFTGDWNIQLEVPEKMYARKEITYQPIAADKDFKITKATLYDTGFKMEGTYNTHEIYPQSPTSEELEFLKSLPEENPLKHDMDIFNYYYMKIATTEEYTIVITHIIMAKK